MQIVDNFNQYFDAIKKAKEIQAGGKLAFTAVASGLLSVDEGSRDFLIADSIFLSSAMQCREPLNIDNFVLWGCDMDIAAYKETKENIAREFKSDARTQMGNLAVSLFGTVAFTTMANLSYKRVAVEIQQKPVSTGQEYGSIAVSGVGAFVAAAIGVVALSKAVQLKYLSHVTNRIIDGDIAVLENKKRSLSL